MTKIKANQLEIREILNDPTAQASETWKGTLRIATQAEVNAGSPAYDNITVVTPRTLAGSNFNTNWLIANNNSDFGTAPTSLGTDSIALGFNARTGTHNEALAIGHQASSNGARGITLGWTSSSTLDSISIGGSIQGNHTKNILIGSNILSAQSYQIAIGAQHKSSYAPTPDVPYSTKIGHAHPTNKNVMHQHSKGKLELLGDEAQFIMPNYSPTGSPATALPSTTNQGGTIYDFDTKTLKFYNGTAWTELNANNWLSANGGDNFDTAPSHSGSLSNSIALGNFARTTGSFAVAIGTTIQAFSNAVAIGLQADALGSGSIAIGRRAKSGTGSEGATVAIGQDTESLLGSQVSIGFNVDGTTVSPTDVQFSTKIGYGIADTNKNMLHLFSKGKLELYGESAQFIMPNYAMGSPTVEPATATEGGVIYDSTLQGLKVYDGAVWQDVGGGGAGAFTLDAQENIFGGTSAGASLTGTANDNFLAGNLAGDALTTGDSNIAIGLSALSSAISSTFCMAFGESALGLCTGNSNIALGYFAGSSITGAINNVLVGAQSGRHLATTSSNNTCIGTSAGAGVATNSATANTFIGSTAGQAIITGGNNVAVGFQAGNITTGNFNTAIGQGAGNKITTSSSTICIGAIAGPSTPSAGNYSNQLFIDVSETDTPLIHGNFATKDVTINGDMETTGNSVSHITINAQTGLSYPLILTDDGVLVTMNNASPNDLVIPANASVSFPIGTQILVEQEGTGTTTIVSAGSPPDVTIHSAGNLFDTASQYTTISLIKKATDTWLIVGDLV